MRNFADEALNAVIGSGCILRDDLADVEEKLAVSNIVEWLSYSDRTKEIYPYISAGYYF